MRPEHSWLIFQVLPLFCPWHRPSDVVEEAQSTWRGILLDTSLIDVIWVKHTLWTQLEKEQEEWHTRFQHSMGSPGGYHTRSLYVCEWARGNRVSSTSGSDDGGDPPTHTERATSWRRNVGYSSVGTETHIEVPNRSKESSEDTTWEPNPLPLMVKHPPRITVSNTKIQLEEGILSLGGDPRGSDHHVTYNQNGMDHHEWDMEPPSKGLGTHPRHVN